MLERTYLNILIVDDNQRMRNAIKNVFDSPKIRFIECNNGFEAVEKYREMQPDWVLMDIVMPVMNGFTATLNIIAEFPDAQIVIVTDYDDKEFRITAKKVGAIAYVLKEDLKKLREICWEKE